MFKARSIMIGYRRSSHSTRSVPPPRIKMHVSTIPAWLYAVMPCSQFVSWVESMLILIKSKFHANLELGRSQVLRFGGAKCIFRRARILFLLYFWNKFSGNKKIWGAQKKFGGTAPECPPVATGLDVMWSGGTGQSHFHQFAAFFAQNIIVALLVVCLFRVLLFNW